MKRSKPKKPNATSAHTIIHCAHDLESALHALTSERPNNGVSRLEELLAALAREFDPASVTMTSTNIPDAIIKLSSVVEETNNAAQRVFTLVERQKTLLGQTEQLSEQVASLLSSSPVNTQAAKEGVKRITEVTRELHSVGHKIVEAQEFQDLSGQKVDKVIKLISGLDERLKLLLTHLRDPIPSAATNAVEDSASDIDQGEADDILKRFGL